jgi:pyridoxal phosphate enzyme (YggS family)
MGSGTPPRAPDASLVDAFVRARAHVLATIAAACARSGRSADEVRLLAVSKTVSADRLVAAVAAGIDDLAENRVQEAAAKVPLVAGARWTLVGPLQSNKARLAVELFAEIQTVDSVALARRLDRLAAEVRKGQRLPVLLQVNVDLDPAKAGFSAADLGEMLPEILGLAALDVRGLMTIGRLVSEPEAARPTFRSLRALQLSLRAAHPALGPELSMGMTDDYAVAIEEGATVVRIGRGLCGARPGL